MTVEPVFDFTKGEFVFSRNGEVILATGKDALKNQIEKILRTPAGRYRIYESSGYGTRIEELIIGKNLPEKYLISELERCIKEAILTLEGVIAIDNFNITRSGSKMMASFFVQSIYGNLEERGVTIYG